MCFGSPKTPEVVKTDPKAEAATAAADAAALANADKATRRVTRRKSALATGAGSAVEAATALGAGKTTLGG
jgi:hypothetical protein